MNFGRLHDGLEQMRERNQIAVEDVLDLFYDMCEDVREETGRNVDQLGLRSEDALMRRLPWTGNLLNRIYRTNKGQFQTQTRMKILQGVQGEVETTVRETEEAAGVMESIHRTQDELRRRKKDLEETLAQTEDARQTCRQLREQIEALEKEIDPGLRDRIRELKEYRQDREKEALSLREEIARRQASLEHAASENGRLQHERDALQEKADLQAERNKNLLDQERKLEDRLSNLDASSRELEEKIRQIQRDLESRDYDNLRQRRLEKIEALEEQRENCTELETDIARTQAALEAEQEKFRAMTADAEAAHKKLADRLEEIAQKRREFEEKEAALEAQCKEDQDQLKRDEEEFRDRTRREEEAARQREDKFEADCQAKRDALAGKEEEFRAQCQAKREELAGLEKDFLEACEEEKAKLRREEEAYKDRCAAQKELIRQQGEEAKKRSDEELRAVQRLAEAQRQEAEKRRLEILHSRERLKQEQEDLLLQEKQMEEDLGRMRSERIEERLERARSRIAVLTEIQGALDENYGVLLQACGKKPEDVPETRLFDTRLDMVDNELKNCAMLYRRLVRSLEGGPS